MIGSAAIPVQTEKKYQVFVSSTYEDLKEEREIIRNNMQRLGFIVAGMEYFPASDSEQMDYIKREISASDYYILITAGRYGSIIPNTNISYTHQEFLHAVEFKIPIFIFDFANTDGLPESKCESTLEGKLALRNFKSEIIKNRLVVKWKNEGDLLFSITDTLFKQVRLNPRDGWIRADNTFLSESFEELHKLRIELDYSKNKQVQKNEFNSILEKNKTIQLNYTRVNTLSANAKLEKARALVRKSVNGEISREQLELQIRELKMEDVTTINLERIDINFNDLLAYVVLGLLSSEFDIDKCGMLTDTFLAEKLETNALEVTCSSQAKSLIRGLLDGRGYIAKVRTEGEDEYYTFSDSGRAFVAHLIEYVVL